MGSVMNLLGTSGRKELDELVDVGANAIFSAIEAAINDAKGTP